MFTFYKFDVVGPGNWTATFLKNDEIIKINKKSELSRFLKEINYLVGYNNYTTCDKLIASVLKGIDPYKTLEKIETKMRVSFNLQNPISIDLKQEIGVELDEIKLNLGYTKDYEDLKTMQEIFKLREDYLMSKFEVVKLFDLKPTDLKRTRVMLAGEVLKTRKGSDKQRLNIKYDNNLSKHELPKQILNFYESIERRFKSGADFEELEKERLTYKLSGLDHVFGFGGLHAAKENYVDEGDFMLIDIKSYYSSLILNNKFLDDKAHKSYQAIYDDKQKFDGVDSGKEAAYKLIINIVYGGLKSPWTRLYNPQISNSVTVNGQLIITHLIQLLDGFCELIQTNTDGLLIKYEPHMKDSILKIIELFEEHYKLTFSIKYINKIAQKDVNNYVIRFLDGSLEAVGRFKNYKGGNFERNSYTIIDKALVEHYMNDVKINRTVMNEYKNNNLELFQYVIKKGSFDGLAQEKHTDTLISDFKDSKMTKVDDVCRVFASRNKKLGSIYRFKKGKETRYTKVPYTSNHCLVNNTEINELNKRLIDLNWYIKECERWLF